MNLISAEALLAMSATTTAIAYLIRQEIYAPYLRGPCRDGVAETKPTHAPTPPISSGSARRPQSTTFAPPKPSGNVRCCDDDDGHLLAQRRNTTCPSTAVALQAQRSVLEASPIGTEHQTLSSSESFKLLAGLLRTSTCVTECVRPRAEDSEPRVITRLSISVSLQTVPLRRRSARLRGNWGLGATAPQLDRVVRQKPLE